MADWPDLDEVKRVIDLDPESDGWDVTVERVRLAAIDKVKRDVGAWDELVDVPDDNMAAAALRMAELMSERPTGPGMRGLGKDPDYQSLLSGRRRRFAIG